jgi:hypothetical protein
MHDGQDLQSLLHVLETYIDRPSVGPLGVPGTRPLDALSRMHPLR